SYEVVILYYVIPGDEDSNHTFENYVQNYLPHAVKNVLRTSKAEEITILGYCIGETMTAMYAALFPGKPLRNLILLTAPIDFSQENTGLYGLWTSEKFFNPDHMVEAFRNIPGELIDTGNRMAKPVT